MTRSLIHIHEQHISWVLWFFFNNLLTHDSFTHSCVRTFDFRPRLFLPGIVFSGFLMFFFMICGVVVFRLLYVLVCVIMYPSVCLKDPQCCAVVFVLKIRGVVILYWFCIVLCVITYFSVCLTDPRCCLVVFVLMIRVFVVFFLSG